MKKILYTLVILFAVFWVPAFASCPVKESEILTGSACSIKELNNPEHVTVKPQRVVNLEFRKERNLRPVNSASQISAPRGCPTIVCLTRILQGNFIGGRN